MSFKRDSIGRSDVYNNPYDIRHVSNPSIKKFRAESRGDTLESQQAILERNLLQKMQEGYFSLPKGALLYVVYAGKGLFFVLMIPSYLFFYGIPKWMLMQGAPAVLKALKTGINRVSEVFKDLVLAQIQEMVRKMLLSLEKVGGLFSKVAEPIQLMNQKFQTIIAENFRKIGEIYEKAVSPFRKGALLIKNVSSWLKAAASSVKLQIVSLIPTFSFEKFKSAQELVLDRFQAVSNLFERYLFKPLESLQKKMAQRTRQVTEPMKKKISEVLKRGLGRIKELVEPVLEVIRERLEKLEELVKNAAHRVSEIVVPLIPVITIPLPIINFFTPIRSAVLRGQERLKKGSSFVVRKLRTLKGWSQSASKWFLKGVTTGGALLAQCLLWIFGQVKKAPPRFWRFLCKMVQVTLEAIRRIAFMVRLLFTWIKVLFKYGMIQVHQFLTQA